jgi:hypothetical protein
MRRRDSTKRRRMPCRRHVDTTSTARSFHPAATFCAEGLLPVYACRASHSARRRSIVSLSIALLAWAVLHDRAPGDDRLAAVVSWSVPARYFCAGGQTATSLLEAPSSLAPLHGWVDHRVGNYLPLERREQARLAPGLSVLQQAPSDVQASSLLPERGLLATTLSTQHGWLAVVELFDPEEFAQITRQSFFTTAPREPDMESACSWRDEALLRPVAGTECFENRWSSAIDDAPAQDEHLVVSPLRRRPTAPVGTMFLWSVGPAGAEGLSTAARQSPSAGVVLTRPPGDYSLDWVGVAISAPIH